MGSGRNHDSGGRRVGTSPPKEPWTAREAEDTVAEDAAGPAAEAATSADPDALAAEPSEVSPGALATTPEPGPASTPAPASAARVAAPWERDLAAGAGGDSGPRARRRTERLRPGGVVGRYIIVERLGGSRFRGVYKAYDPELERHIALALLRADRWRESELAAAQARLYREAQILAQLSHPNVVPVYDVGTYGDDVFVAMEFVVGQPLSDWLEDKHPIGEVLAVLQAAGRGLAAAHAAGLCHRDLHPTRVMIGDDDRVRLLGFALVRPPDDAHARATPVPVDALVAAPGYAAPELHRGARGDERSDQFAFCALAYRALCLHSAFAGADDDARVANLLAARVRPVPREVRLPAWLRAVVLRGLHGEPEQRFPSMDALLEAVAGGLKRQRRQRLAVASALAVAAVVVSLGTLTGALLGWDTGELQCRARGDDLIEIWDTGGRERLADAFRATERPHAAISYQRVAGALSTYSHAWEVAYEDACDDTYRRGEQSRALLDLRLRCLERRGRMFETMVDGLSDDVDGALVDRAVTVPERLPPVAECYDEDMLLGAPPLASDPVQRERVDELAARIDDAEVQLFLGRMDVAESSAEQLVAAADQLGAPGVQARAYYLRGEVQAAQGRYTPAELSFEHAAPLAARASDDHLTARIWLALVRTVGVGARRAHEGLTLSAMAETALARAGDRSALRAEHETLSGLLLAATGDSRAAVEHLERGLAYELERHAGSSLTAVEARLRLARVLAQTDDHQRARDLYQGIVPIVEQRYGRYHPILAAVLGDLGRLFDRSDACAEARAPYRRALGIVLANGGAGGEEAGRLRAALERCELDVLDDEKNAPAQSDSGAEFTYP